MRFRVIIAPDDIRRLHIESLPDTLDAFIDILKRELSLDGTLIVQFEDPSFGNELCNLTSMSDLTGDTTTLKVFQKHIQSLQMSRTPPMMISFLIPHSTLLACHQPPLENQLPNAVDIYQTLSSFQSSQQTWS